MLKLIKFVLGIILAFFGAIFLIALITPNKTPAQKDAEEPCSSSGMAYVMAEDFVKQALVAPATADFAGLNDAKIDQEPDCTYVISSYVDSQNSFGANIRTTFLIRVAYLGNDKWRSLGISTQP